MRNKEFIEKIKAFRAAAEEVNQYWPQDDIENAVLKQRYPFNLSFDDQLAYINNWASHVIKKLEDVPDLIKIISISPEAVNDETIKFLKAYFLTYKDIDANERDDESLISICAAEGAINNDGAYAYLLQKNPSIKSDIQALAKNAAYYDASYIRFVK